MGSNSGNVLNFEDKRVKRDGTSSLSDSGVKSKFYGDNRAEGVSKDDCFVYTPIEISSMASFGLAGRLEETMDNNDILKTYIDKIDRDQTALREDIRESERRTSGHIASVEEKMDARLNRIEDMIAKSNDRLDLKMASIEGKIESVDSKIDAKLETFRGELREHKIFRASMTIAIIGVCLATIIGIATMV